MAHLRLPRQGGLYVASGSLEGVNALTLVRPYDDQCPINDHYKRLTLRWIEI